MSNDSLGSARWAKDRGVNTYDELERLVYECDNEITGADFTNVRKKLNIKLF